MVRARRACPRVPARIGKQGEQILHALKVNERWRVALAGLVAALAVPFLIVDSPAPAGGVEAGDEVETVQVVAPVFESDLDEIEESPRAVEIVVIATEVSPDIGRLADQAGTWSLARAQAIEEGRVEATFTAPPSKTDYSLLPTVNVVAARTEAVEVEAAPEAAAVEDVSVMEEASESSAGDAAGPKTPESEAADPVEPVQKPSKEPDPASEPTVDSVSETEAPVEQRAAPTQVDGRVPPPSGGPTAAQWNALRKCESTHNYAAVSPSGLYRGAYQFSQQTWDWVAGIHWPHLVAVDPIDTDPAWQDVMAYTLYAMRGWDQWPICGKNLL